MVGVVRYVFSMFILIFVEQKSKHHDDSHNFHKSVYLSIIVNISLT